MSESLVLSERDDHTLTIILNRPEKRNALNSEMYEDLIELLGEACDDPQIRVVVLKGSDGNFTSGNDLSDFQEIPEDADESNPAFRFIKEIAFFDKILVTQVEGYAVGVGATMLLHSDFVIAEDESQIRFPFVDLGGVPEAGSTLLLPMMAGYQKTAELIYLADFVSASQGKEIGFVTEVVDANELEDRVDDISNRLAGKAPKALRESKRLIKENYWEKLEDTIEREMKAFHERILSEEGIEAISAFMEGREPQFD